MSDLVLNRKSKLLRHKRFSKAKKRSSHSSKKPSNLQKITDTHADRYQTIFAKIKPKITVQNFSNKMLYVF